MNAADVFGRLDGVRKRRAGWVARCPAHPDRTPSLSINEGDDGRVLLYCFAGCDFQAIVAALGLAARDLMGDGPAPPPRSPAESIGADLLTREKWTDPDVLELYQLADLQRTVDGFVADVRQAETVNGDTADWERLALAAQLECEALALAAETGAPW